MASSQVTPKSYKTKHCGYPVELSVEMRHFHWTITCAPPGHCSFKAVATCWLSRATSPSTLSWEQMTRVVMCGVERVQGLLDTISPLSLSASTLSVVNGTMHSALQTNQYAAFECGSFESIYCVLSVNDGLNCML